MTKQFREAQIMNADKELYVYLKTTLEFNPDAPLLGRAKEYVFDNNLKLKRTIEAICFDVILELSRPIKEG